MYGGFLGPAAQPPRAQHRDPQQGGASQIQPGEASIPGPIGDRKGEAAVIELAAAASRVVRLVQRAQEGDRDAFGELYRLYHASIFRLARFSVPASDAEDVVAETFLRAWESLPRYRDKGAPFVAWLYGIARHVAADAGRRMRRTVPMAYPPDRVVDPGNREDDRLDLAAAMALLGEEQRTVIELKFFMGLSNADVARALGKTPGAVNALQWRALGALSASLESR